jgi:hypothetical protein
MAYGAYGTDGNWVKNRSMADVWDDISKGFSANVASQDALAPALQGQQTAEQTALAASMMPVTNYTDPMVGAYNQAVLQQSSAANPYDTRYEAMVAGPNNAADRAYEEAMRQLAHQYGVTDNLGSPAFLKSEQDASMDWAGTKLGVESDWAKQAAAQDVTGAQNNIQNLAASGALNYGVESGLRGENRQTNQDYNTGQQQELANLLALVNAASGTTGDATGALGLANSSANASAGTTTAGINSLLTALLPYFLGKTAATTTSNPYGDELV